VASTDGPDTKLKVTFFWPFSGDYWIIDLDPEYRWAVVGEPSRKYFWILSREPRMDDATYQRILERATEQGYKLESLIRTAQDARADSSGKTL
jgi:apolipoprotein D and lipocalin family protein